MIFYLRTRRSVSPRTSPFPGSRLGPDTPASRQLRELHSQREAAVASVMPGQPIYPYDLQVSDKYFLLLFALWFLPVVLLIKKTLSL